MIPFWHFVASTALFLSLYPFFGISSALVYISGWLIDIDHMFYYTFKFKSINYFKARKYFSTLKPSRTKVMNIFHTAEVWFVMIVSSFFSRYALRK